MKLLALLATLATAHASEFPLDQAHRLAIAIYHAEGGPKARTPFGVTGVKDFKKARAVCLRLIQKSWEVYEVRLEAGMENRSFIQFLGEIYAPVGASNDPTGLNKNWIYNVTYFYRRNKFLQ